MVVEDFFLQEMIKVLKKVDWRSLASMVGEAEFRSLNHSVSAASIMRRVAGYCREEEWDLFY